MTNVHPLRTEEPDPFDELTRSMDLTALQGVREEAVSQQMQLNDKLPTAMEDRMMKDARQQLDVLRQNRKVLEAQFEIDGREQRNEFAIRQQARLESIARHEAEIIRLRELDGQDHDETHEHLAMMGDKYDAQFRSIDKMVAAQTSVLAELTMPSKTIEHR